MRYTVYKLGFNNPQYTVGSYTYPTRDKPMLAVLSHVPAYKFILDVLKVNSDSNVLQSLQDIQVVEKENHCVIIFPINFEP